MPFYSAGDGDLKTAFLTNAWLMERFVGNSLFAWGANTYGQLGDNTTTNRSSPIQTVAQNINWTSVSCKGDIIAAIKNDGTLWTWSWVNPNNTINLYSSPIQSIAYGTNWKQVSCGFNHGAAVKTDGTLWCWAYQNVGNVGDNTITARSSPVQTVAYGTDWKQVSCNSLVTGAVKTNGTLWMWGSNGSGQLGDNTTISRSSPVQTVTFANNWKQISCGESGTAAIKNDGTLWVWGGQGGDNTAITRSSPVQTVAMGSNWANVSCGSSHTAAIKTDGTLWLWGSNNNGQLGDNTAASKSSPVQTVAFGTNWKQVSCGLYHTVAIKTDGSMWSWGYNNYGQLGDNTVTARSSPVQTGTFGNNWKIVACGWYHTAAVTFADIQRENEIRNYTQKQCGSDDVKAQHQNDKLYSKR